MARNLMIAVLLLILVGSAGAYHPRNPEGKFLTPEQWQRLGLMADSSHSFDVRHYRLDLALAMTSGAYTARERIAIKSRVASLDSFSLYMNSLVCDSVKRGPVRLSFATPANWLTITLDTPLPNGDSTAVDVFYHRNSGTANQGFYWYARSAQTLANLAYTTTEPSDSRYWFPCWDEPYDKAERGCQINITVPDTFTACSNGLLDSVTTNVSARTKTFWWTHLFPISTYLMNFAASKYSTWHQNFVRAPGDTVESLYFVWPADSARSVTAFQNVPDMLSFFSRPDVYGPYPFEKYGMVAVYPFVWGGMEHQTMTTIHRSWLSGSDWGISHELAHMWWGDRVTCYTWPNIWLNEGFATYSEALYMEHQQGHAYFLNEMDGYAQDYFSEDAGQRFPMYNPPSNQLFAWGTIYCKGAWVQHMLRYVEHDTTATHGLFFQALRAYGDSLKYGTASMADYQRIHERFFGQGLSWFFNEWAVLAGYPQYLVNWYGVSQPPNWRIVVDISQSNGNGAPPVFHMPVEILFHLAGKDTLVHYPITSSPQRNTFLVSAQPQSAVFDPNAWILKRVTMTNGVESAAMASGSNGFRFEQNTPNPFQTLTEFSCGLPSDGPVRLCVYDVLGRKVRTLLDAREKAGAYRITWNGRDDHGKALPGGVYLCRFEADGQSLILRAVKVR